MGASAGLVRQPALVPSGSLAGPSGPAAPREAPGRVDDAVSHEGFLLSADGVTSARPEDPDRAGEPGPGQPEVAVSRPTAGAIPV
jgi:hypothetical protein